MKRTETDLPGVCILEPDVFGDARGFFMETYNRKVFADLDIHDDFVQDNHSRSRGGVLRGLHYQVQQTQAKLVRALRGEVFDIAVDVRRGSRHFGRWIGVTLTEDDPRMLYIPKGFAHGLYVVSDVAEFTYKVDDFYAPEHERGIIWSDPDVGIDWPPGCTDPVLSDRDAVHGRLSDLDESDLPM